MKILEYKTYEEAREKFTWGQVWDLFDGNKDSFNIAHECIDRHVDKGTAARIKFDDDHTEEYTFAQISKWSSQFAWVLKDLGINPGDRVTIMLEPSREFYTSFFGVLKQGCQVVPCFTLFAPEAAEYRIKDSGSRILITTAEIAKGIDKSLLDRIITTGKEFDDLLRGKPESFKPYPTKARDIAVLQYTSGTTKKFPDAVKHFHQSLYVTIPNAIFVIGLRPGDRYFCPASPAWGYGVWYGTLAPLALGIAVGAYSGKFDEVKMLEALQEFEINNLSAAPTIFRRIKNLGIIDNYKLKIKKLSYSGEPLGEDTFNFIKDKFGAAPCGFYGSTEVGVILANFGVFEDCVVKPGSLGKPVMGLEVAVIDEKGNAVPPNTSGEIAVKRGKDWFYVKDIGVVDDDGYFWCKGRSDDVIISAGWTISSVEVESTLSLHEDVIEATVIPVPDEDRGQIIRAYVQTNREPTKEFIKELQEFVKERLGKFEYPRQIHFLDNIPKAESGKVDRKKLKEMAAAER
ncbi:MAG: acyl-CoA synthetase [Syntrophales bacterium]|nr:acyl-CoA synthetase [Syntrophales bacterium]